MEQLVTLSPALGVVGLVIAYLIYLHIVKQPVGTEKMKEIADMIHDGSMVYLKKQYSIIAVFINWQTALAFIGGAVSSMLAGFFGMKGATKANVRTAQAANLYKPDTARALSNAFLGGSVMGLSVASIGLIGVGVLFIIYGKIGRAHV